VVGNINDGIAFATASNEKHAMNVAKKGTTSIRLKIVREFLG